MHGTVITKTYRFYDFPHLRSQKSDPRGVPEMYRIDHQKLIDSMIFVPFGLQSFFGAKNRIREGCQKCIIGSECQKLIDSMIFRPVWAPERFRSQKSDPRGVPRMSRIEYQKLSIPLFSFRLGSRMFSAPTIGSERGARNV